MQKRIAIVLIAILFIVVGLSGCNETSSDSEIIIDQRLIGTWKQSGTPSSPSYVFTFFDDGTCSIPALAFIQSVSGYWKIEGNQLIIDYQFEGTLYTSVYEYSFSNDYQRLMLNNVAGLNYTLIKQ